MTSHLSVAVLNGVIDASIRASKDIERENRSPSRVKKFGREEIGQEAFGVDYGAAPLSRLGSERYPLTREQANQILVAIKRLFEKQCQNVSRASGRAVNPNHYLQRVCNELGLRGDWPSVNDLYVDAPFPIHESDGDSSIDNLMDWDASQTWRGADKPAGRLRSIRLLRNLKRIVSHESMPEAQLRLAHVAVSAALHHPPGSSRHEEACRLASEICEDARVFTLSESIRDKGGLASSARRIRSQLSWCRVAPHMSSRTNYLRYAIRREPMPAHVWTTVQESLQDVIRLNTIRLRLDGQDDQNVADAASGISMEGRMLQVVGGAAAERAAIKAYHLSQEIAKHKFEPYSIAYPIVQDIVHSRNSAAADKCERAITLCRQEGHPGVASAYAAMMMQITAGTSTAPTSDSLVWALAREAVESDQISFLCPHVFDREAVRALLK